MKKIFSLLVILMVFIISCNKEEPEEPLSAQVIKEVEVQEEAEDVIEEEEETIITVKLCHDTDNGMLKWVNGSVFGFYNNAERFEFNDYCQDSNYLVEFYCEDENPEQQIFLCRNGCVDNHCQ